MAKFTVQVTQLIEVELDESKFDEQFMSEFCASFYSFDTIEGHAEHCVKQSAPSTLPQS